jgi:hypothetical protein
MAEAGQYRFMVVPLISSLKSAGAAGPDTAMQNAEIISAGIINKTLFIR